MWQTQRTYREPIQRQSDTITYKKLNEAEH